MAILHVSETDYQTISQLAELHQITPEAYIAEMLAGRVAIEDDIETLEVLNDPAALAAIEADRAAQARGEPPQGTPIEDILRELGIDE